MNIVQINVRLSEGGAARVALNLHKGALERRCGSTFAYGYGKRGRNSGCEGVLPGVLRITPMHFAVANWAHHHLIGHDQWYDGERIRVLREVLDAADIVHMHAVHSHMIPIAPLLSLLDKKSLVWTHHDYWALTGRCAVPGDCMRWSMGCRPCADLSAYPSSFFDTAGAMWDFKRRLLGRATGIVHVAPSEHLARALAAEFSREVRVVANGLDDEFAKALDERGEAPESGSGLLIVANNLGDRRKNNQPLIRDLAAAGAQVVTIGDNSPFVGPNVSNRGTVAGRKELIDAMDSAAALLFTSSIDNQPLVIIEALCAGLPVLWTESQAAREILAPFGVEPVASADDVLAELNHGFSKSGWSRWRRREISKLALERFGSSEMVDMYFNLYNELMSC